MQIEGRNAPSVNYVLGGSGRVFFNPGQRKLQKIVGTTAPAKKRDLNIFQSRLVDL